MNQQSPGAQVWKRFKNNKTAFAGLCVIVIATLVAIFAYVIIPDRTPDSNRMSLLINNRPPGTVVHFLKIPKSNPVETSLLGGFLMGEKDHYDYIPVNWCELSGKTIRYREYNPETDSSFFPVKTIPLNEFKLNANENITSDQFVISRRFVFGTDRYGRDLLSRIMAGTRVTFTVGLVAVIISLVVGVVLGSLAGFFRGKIDLLILWLINVVWSVPTLLLVIAITLVLGKGFEQVFIAVGLTMWVDVARMVRGQIFGIRELEFVAAGRALGYKSPRIILRHILPNIVGPVLVVAAANFSTAILLEAGLSFLGIGAQPPTPSWGAMIKEYYGYIIIPGSAYLAILPGLAIMMLTMAFTFVANGLRDAVDSKTQIEISG